MMAGTSVHPRGGDAGAQGFRPLPQPTPAHRLSLALLAYSVLSFSQVLHAETMHERDERLRKEAVATYTLENISNDALCGDASYFWNNAGGAFRKGWVEEREAASTRGPDGSPGYPYHWAKMGFEVLGMRVKGLGNGGDHNSLWVIFERPLDEVVARLPGRPDLSIRTDVGHGMVEYKEKKSPPRMLAMTWQGHTMVSCERPWGFRYTKP